MFGQQVTSHSLQRQESIVVTGTFTPTPLAESTRSVVEFTTDENRELYSSAAGYLHQDSSIDLQERAVDGVQADLSIRGSSFGQTLVLVNGFRINDAQTGHHNLDVPFPMEAISEIEVLHGSGSTLYGADAVGGVVNFITKAPALNEIRLRAGIGNFGTNEQTMLAAFALGRVWERFSASRIFSTGFEPDRDYRSTAATSDTWFRSSLGETTLLVSGSDRPFGANQFYGSFPSWERTKGWFIAGTQQIGTTTFLSAGYRRHTDEFILFRDQPSIYENNHVSESWQASIRRNTQLRKPVVLAYGLDADADAIHSNNLGDHARNRTAGYFNVDLRYFHRFSASAGLREEMFSGGHIESSPTIASALWLRPSLKVIGSVSHAFRLPTYTDLYYQDPANIGNPLLKPERAWSFEIGPYWRPRDSIALKSVFFRRNDRDDIDYVRAIDTDPWRAMNVDRIQFVGVETSLTVSLARTETFSVGYTALQGEQRKTTELSKYVFNYPSEQATLSWFGQPCRFITARSRLGVVQRLGNSPYVLWDFSTSADLRYFRPYLRLDNLTDTKYQEIPGIDLPGRSIVGGIEIAWHR